MSDETTAPPPASSDAAPASSPETSSAAPDTRAIAASVFAGDQGENQAAPPPADPSSPPPPSDATIRVGEDDDPEYQNLLASGSMPVDRHKAVLTNARRKTREEVEQAARQKYGWIDDLQVDRRQTEQALGLVRALDANPERALRAIALAMGIDLTPPAPAQPKDPEGPPPPDVKLDDGSEFYSAPQLAKLQAWQAQEFDRKLAAFEERYKPLEQERHLSQMRSHAHVEAGNILAHMRATKRYFKDLEPDIKARMQADPRLDLKDAYDLARDAHEDKAKQASDTDRTSQLQRKAAASNPGPGAARPVTPLRYSDRSTRDIAAEVFGRAR